MAQKFKRNHKAKLKHEVKAVELALSQDPKQALPFCATQKVDHPQTHNGMLRYYFSCYMPSLSSHYYFSISQAIKKTKDTKEKKRRKRRGKRRGRIKECV